MSSEKSSTLNTQRSILLRKILTIYGRKPVLEALQDPNLQIYRLHLAESNRPSKELKLMVELAEKRGVEIRTHEKKALSRISKNGRQDQGVALDIILENLIDPEEFLQNRESFRIVALDRVTNPQNVGMIIRSCAAGAIDGLLLAGKGNAPLVSPLTIKASAGTLFKLPIIRGDSLLKSLRRFQEAGSRIYTLDSHAELGYRETEFSQRSIFVLGNESEGVTPEIEALSDASISIPMNRGVESLNVAVTAALLAFCTSSP